ncbi:uncharacterized protein [Lolium perenne]|uniref:uncharacterized protein n=1 Tax=Lolium perenne TaxID=4522 RepID=UPI0021EB1D72|nr:uncharacterized protein LOC127336442 [Lolium perenne]
MSHGVAARKRFGGVGFALGCGCKDPKAVAVAVGVAASSPRSGTEASTATTATSRRARTHPSGSGSTGTLTVPSASSSSFLWEDAEADGDEVEFKRPSSATTPSFSGLLRELRELEQSVKSSCARKSLERNHSSPPPPPPLPPQLPPRPLQRRADKASSIKEGHGDFSPPSPPPPPPLPPPLRPPQRRVVRGDDKPSIKEEGHGDFSPPRPPPLSPTQQHRRVRSIDKVNGHEGDPRFTPLPPRPLPPPPPLEPLPRAKTEEEDASAKKKIEDTTKRASTPPKHRKARSCDATTGANNHYRLDGSVAVVKQSEDPLGDFRRSMLNMIVENGIVAGDELRELLRRFLALNAPRHHDAILRAFAEIWDEVFAVPAAAETQPREQPTFKQAAAPRQRTPPRRRPQPPPAWRV